MAAQEIKMNRARIGMDEYEATYSDDPEEMHRRRVELFKSKGLPVLDNGTFDLERYNLGMKVELYYEYEWELKH